MPSRAVLVLRNVHKAWRFGNPGSPALLPVLRGASITLCAGERVTVVAGRGAGSTTLLLVAAGLARADAGIALGPWLAGGRGLVRLVPTRPVLPSSWTPRDVVMAGLASRWPASAAVSAVERALRQQGLAEHADVELRKLPRAAAWRAAAAAAQLAGAGLILLDREPEDAAELNAVQASLAVAEPMVFGAASMSVTLPGAAAALNSRIASLENGVLREVQG